MVQKQLFITVTLLIFIFQAFSQKINTNEISVDSCVRIAIKNNYELKVNEQNKNIAVKEYEIQKADLFPSINLNSEYQFTDQFDATGRYNVGSASIQLYQTIWQNGKIKAAVKQAKINAKATEIWFSINKADVVYSTISSYINLLRNNKIKLLTNKMLKRFAITVDAAKERFKLGASKRSDVLKAETEYSNVEYFSIQANTSSKTAEQNLLKTIGFSQNSSIKTKDFLDKYHADIESITTDSLIKIADENLSELKLINKQIEQQEVSVLVQKKNRYPEIGAFTNYNWVDSPIYDKDFYGTVGLSLRLNIFNGFQKKNVIALEKVKLDQLNLQEQEIRRSIINEVQITKLQLIDAREKISNAFVRVKSSKENLEVTTEEYLQGLSSMLELVSAQYNEFEANRNLINAQSDYQLAILTLKRKTGLLAIQYNF